jgi:broad specificity phosphatase PhoE
MDPLPVVLIRHGSTRFIESRKLPAIDDPLSATGREQAQSLRAVIDTLSDIAIVVVSPLDRALETAVRAFAGRPDVKFIVSTALREFNMRQTEHAELFDRHTGTPLHVLRARYDAHSSAHSSIETCSATSSRPFSSAALSPSSERSESDSTYPRRAGIVWPAHVGDDDAWWEPHGSFYCSEEHAVQTAFERVQDAGRLIRQLAADLAPLGQRVAVVAHENLFRVLTGCIMFPVAQVRRVRIIAPNTPVTSRAS